MENFGEQLKNKRKESGISQSDLANKLGVHSQTVSKWERGIMFPDVGQYGDIANALGMPLEKLLDQPLGDKYYKGEFSVQLLSETITMLRREKAISQSDLADAVGYSSDAVSRWERGVTSPDIDSIIIMSRMFGIPLSTLYYGVPSQKQAKKRERDRKFARKLKIVLGAISSAAVVALGVTLAVLIPGKTAQGKIENPGRYSEVVVDGEIMRVLTGTRYTPKSKEKRGYDFVGWKDQSGDFVTIPVTIEKEFMTLDPVYELHEYGIEYDLGGGEFPCDPPTSFNVTSGEINIPVPTRLGYEFLGWEVREGFGYREVTTISCCAKDIVLRARWKDQQPETFVYMDLFECERYLVSESYGYAVALTKYLGEHGSDVGLEIPGVINGEPVIKIDCAFGSETEGEYYEYNSITLPTEVNELGENAFARVKCYGIEIPYEVQKIGRNCFNGAHFEQLSFAPGSFLMTVDEDAFADVILSEPLVLPEQVTEIKKGGLRNVCAVLNDGLKKIESGAIVLEEGNEEIFIPSSLQYIGENGITCANKEKGRIYMQGDASSAGSFAENWNGGIRVEYSHKAAWITFIDGEGRYKKHGYYVILYSPGSSHFVGWETENGVMITGKIYHGGYGTTLTARYQK